MPFRSTAQRSYLAIHHPDVAHKFAMEGSSAGKKLPKHVPKKGPLQTMHDKMNGRK